MSTISKPAYLARSEAYSSAPGNSDVMQPPVTLYDRERSARAMRRDCGCPGCHARPTAPVRAGRVEAVGEDHVDLLPLHRPHVQSATGHAHERRAALVVIRWRHEGRIAGVDGRRLQGQVVGEGRPAVVLQGAELGIDAGDIAVHAIDQRWRAGAF